MQHLRRLTIGLQGLPKRQTWHNLSAYTQTTQDLNAWKELRARDSLVQVVVDKETKASTTESIDWSKWQSTINHTKLVECLKSFYENQVQLVNNLASEDHLTLLKSQTAGWNLYEDAIVSCQKSVEYSEGLVSNGARALWVSYNNPPIWKVDTNEWVESDLYWQAYIEKHHFYNPNPTSNDPELPNEIEASKKTWNTKVNSFNDRGYTSILYCYMEHLPSWEYYDLHRRAFLEHMTYYLTLTGGTYKFFPECPPWQWLTDIENYRFQFISLVHRRRASMQLKNLERERALDLQPIDYEHDGEEFHTKLIQSEARSYELMIGRMMGNFLFLTHPFIPFQTYTGYINAMNSDGGLGSVFSIGEDVNALYYLPAQHSHEPPSPKKALSSLFDHMALTGRKFNPGYAGLFDIFVDIVSKRPSHWFNSPDETFADTFLSRMSTEEASYPVYKFYVDEMKAKFSNAKEITDSEIINKTIQNMELLLEQENLFYEQLAFTINPDLAEEFQQQKDLFTNLYNTNHLQTLLEIGSLSSSPKTADTAHSVMQNFSQADENQTQILDYMKALKLGDLEKAITTKK